MVDENSPNYSKIMDYIDHNPAAVLGTADSKGPHGAVVYIITASHGTVCFVTKNKTQKYQKLIKQPIVSLTFFNEREGTTLQATGEAFVADDTTLRDIVMDKMAKAHAIMADWLPPVSKLDAGEYVVIGITLTSARLAEYQGLGNNGPKFTVLT